MSIGKKIKLYRNRRGLTQVRLAEMANISRSYLAGVEVDKYNPSVDTLTEIATALQTPVSNLIGEERSRYSNVEVFDRELDRYVPLEKEDAPPVTTEEALRKYFIDKVGREPSDDELRRLDDFAETFIKGLDK